MNLVISENAGSSRRRRRLSTAIKESLRELSIQLSLLNHHVGARVDLKDADLDCLDFINRHGPLSPSALARRAGLHPATMTGIIDRLERGGWVARDRGTLRPPRRPHPGTTRPQLRTAAPLLGDEHLNGPDLRRIRRGRTPTARRLPPPDRTRRTNRHRRTGPRLRQRNTGFPSHVEQHSDRLRQRTAEQTTGRFSA